MYIILILFLKIYGFRTGLTYFVSHLQPSNNQIQKSCLNDVEGTFVPSTYNKPNYYNYTKS